MNILHYTQCCATTREVNITVQTYIAAIGVTPWASGRCEPHLCFREYKAQDVPQNKVLALFHPQIELYRYP